MKSLYVIPARGGSKGIPLKNIKDFEGKPLILHSIDHARLFSDDDDICVSTDNLEIIQIVENYGLQVPFVRPSEFAQDSSSSYDVIIHALDYYKSLGVPYDRIILLQPTSPLRKQSHIQECLDLYNNDLDMVVTVEAIPNPIYSCYNETEEGYLKKVVANNYIRRQDIPMVYRYNGAVYVINVSSLRKMKISDFSKIKKVVMDDISSIDIDSPKDWYLAEYYCKNRGNDSQK